MTRTALDYSHWWCIRVTTALIGTCLLHLMIRRMYYISRALSSLKLNY